jgi:hypothetical protein
MTKYDRSLTEVWEWKDAVCGEMNGLTAREYADRVKNDADSTLIADHIELVTLSMAEKREKVA